MMLDHLDAERGGDMGLAGARPADQTAGASMAKCANFGATG